MHDAGEQQPEEHILVDLFGGSTLIACERLGRSARPLEFDPRYADVILRRYLEFSGQQPVLDGANQSFEEVTRERKNVAA